MQKERDDHNSDSPTLSDYLADCSIRAACPASCDDWQISAPKTANECILLVHPNGPQNPGPSDELPMPDDAERDLAAVFRKVDDVSSTEAYWCKQVFLPSEVFKHLPAHDPCDALPAADNAEGLRVKAHAQTSYWRRMANDPANGTRRMVVGCAKQVKAVEAIARAAPNFATLCAVFAQALKASVITKTPFRVPPILLMGPPGIGKTYVAAAIARTIGTGFVSVAMTTATSVNPLGGTSMAWKNPRIGMVAKALIDGDTACPVVLLDEIDKAFRLPGDADPLGPLHALMEGETAQCFLDEFLELPVAADNVIWISTANSVAEIAPSILDRHLILEIAPPDPGQMRRVINSIYHDASQGYGSWFDPQLSPAVADRLVAVHPRRVKRLLSLACARAASLRRREVVAADIEAVLAITGPAKAGSRIGFLN